MTSGTVSKALSSFNERGITEPVLVYGERGIALDREHPLFEVLAAQVWTGYGIRWSDRCPDARPHIDYDPSSPYDVNDWPLQMRVPDALRARGNRRPDPVRADGPDLLTARAVTKRLSAVDRFDVHAIYQELYANDGHERDRDMIHHVGSLGYGTWHAERALRESVRRDPCSRTDPASEPVDATAWIFATYCVRAEILALRHAALGADRLANAGHQVRQLQIQRSSLLERRARTAATGEPSSDHVDDELDRLTAQISAETTKVEESDDYRAQRAAGVASLDTGAERYVAVVCRHRADTLARIHAQMATHPSLAAWHKAHPNLEPAGLPE